jgi:hypothetical protein
MWGKAVFKSDDRGKVEFLGTFAYLKKNKTYSNYKTI